LDVVRTRIANYLPIPLAKLPPEQLDWINTLVDTTLNKKEVVEQVEGGRILWSSHRKGITMLSDFRNYYGLARDLGQAGYFETEHSEQIVGELKLEIKARKPLWFHSHAM
jgi:hypothetical protein